MKVLAFGEVLWDIFPEDECIGGAPLNFAAHLSKMGEEAYVLTSVGNDALGTKSLQFIGDFGVKTDYISVLDCLETGKCLVTLDSNKVPKYNLLQNVAYDEIPVENIPDNFDVLYFGTLALRNGFNRDSLNKLLENNSFKEIFVDVNIRPPFYSKETIEFAVSNATILKISDEESPKIADALGLRLDNDFARRLCERYENLKLVIITLGSRGSYCYERANNREYRAGCIETIVASTVGAGDSFSAAFLHKYLCGAGIKSCLNFAAKISGFVVSKTEAIPNYNVENF